jgi:hypothetical protein
MSPSSRIEMRVSMKTFAHGEPGARERCRLEVPGRRDHAPARERRCLNLDGT